ncbi:MAG: NAD-dependent epimerase/dehydratase family protein [Acidimicrobiales bacterium]
MSATTRVLVTGMGGDLGTRVVNLLEADSSIGEILGLDRDPPRRRIHRVEFHRVEPGDRRKAVHLVRDFDPEVVLHLGVYEPNARADPTRARLDTAASAVSVLGAAAACPSLRSIVVRSGIEVYGRRRQAPTRPDEASPVDPTSPFGTSMAEVEQVAVEAGHVAGVPVTRLRLATVLGPSFPSPLGRYLRLPVVAVDPLRELPFSLLHQEDAALAMVAASSSRLDGPLNVVGPGAVTASQAVRSGRRIPVPVAGPGWGVARMIGEFLGAPLPPHTRELLVRGRVADGAWATEVLGIDPRSTRDVVDQLYRWDQVAKVAPTPAAGADAEAGS